MQALPRQRRLLLAVHIALREVGAPFEAIAVDLATHTLAGGVDYRTVSPRGCVPLLELDDGSRHTEGNARCCRTWPTSIPRTH